MNASVDNPEIFRDMIELLKSKWYIREDYVAYDAFCCHDDYLKKELEIGDISIHILARNDSNKYLAILTDDKKFANIADKKYGLVTIYYDDIRNATFDLDPKNIPAKLLEEPVKVVELI